MKQSLKISCLIIIFLIFFVLEIPAETKQQILVLHSYHKGFSWTDGIDAALREKLENNAGYEVVSEYLDSKRWPLEKTMPSFAEILKIKFKDSPPVAIILSDNNALTFLNNYYEKLFPEIPVIFCGINNYNISLLEKFNNKITGVVEKTNPGGTVDLIKQLQPNLQRLIVVAGTSSTAKEIKYESEISLSKYKESLEIIWWDNYSAKELLNRLGNLSQNDAVLLTLFNSDKAGHFFSYEESGKMISDSSTAPVYGMWDFYLNTGVIGGKMISSGYQGMAAADLFLSIIETGQIPPVIENTPNMVIADFNAMTINKLDKSRLPDGAILINEPVSFYNRYKVLIWNTVLIFTLLFVAFMGAVFGLIKVKRSEKRIQQIKENLHITLHSIGDAVIATDINSCITQMNPVAESLTGWQFKEAFGKHLNKIFVIINSQTRNPVDNPVEEVLRKGNKVGLANHTVLISRTRQEYQISDSASPIKDIDNNIVGVVLVFRDVTEEYSLFKAIQKSEILHRSLFEKSNDAVFILDKKTGVCLDANKAALEITGRTLIELKSKTIRDISPESADIWITSKKDTPPTTETVQVTYITPNNIRKIARVNSVSLDKNTIVGIASDITHDLEMEKQLRQSQKMESMGTLAGGIAHDFNNILAGILGYIQLIEMDFNNIVEVKGNIKQIRKGAQRATELVQQILAFSRQAEHKKVPLKLYKIVKEAIKFLHSSIPSTIEIYESISSNAAILADPTQIHQVIINLCTNAFHAMQDSGGILTVDLSDHLITDNNLHDYNDQMPGNYVRLEVSDTGQGMDTNTINRIFDPYFTTKIQGKGTGLGLSVVDGIVKNHNGFIKTYSEINRGTKIQVYWPITDHDDFKNISKKISINPAKGTEKILILDDELDILKTIQSLLESQGYKTTIVQNATSALDIFKKNPDNFDLILTDMTMPQMTGIEFSKTILTIRNNIPIILCTGYHEGLTESAVLKMGIRKYIQKPVLPDDLFRLIREVLDNNNF